MTARKDTVSYRTSKFIERNKARLITAAVILVALLAGVATIVRQIRVAKTERAKFEAQQARFDRPLDFTRAGDYVSVASSATLNPSAAMTITVWFTVQKSEDLQFLVSKFNHHSGPLGVLLTTPML